MTWYADLAPCDYFATRTWPDGCSSVLRAVGWLSAEHQYQRGLVSAVELERLVSLLANAWSFVDFRGSHTCELCLAYSSNGNLFVPGEAAVYVSPEAILHYVQSHGYLPPREFLDSMLACPPMRSDQYLAALVKSGGKAFGLMTRLVDEPTPCPYCGKPLITPRAKLCHYCKMDWHDPTCPRKLGAA